MVQETNSRELLLGELSVIVRELTVQQVRAWLQDSASEQQFDYIGEWLIEGCTLRDIQRMTTLTSDQIDSLRPSQIESVATACKELNPHFFGLLGRAQALAQANS